ncbi:uncharacterized protein EDB93DRAFT_1039871, partial [Suillus bovinus]|uniref:uncharacterized protein n=1 Tax=Suillus bovinus TaxID=48563 RepID=UPI001B864CBD
NRYHALNNLATALNTRYNTSKASKDLNETINLYRESLQLWQQGHPDNHTTLLNLRSAFCSRFMQIEKNKDVEVVIRLCQKSLKVLPSLHSNRKFQLL